MTTICIVLVIMFILGIMGDLVTMMSDCFFGISMKTMKWGFVISSSVVMVSGFGLVFCLIIGHYVFNITF